MNDNYDAFGEKPAAEIGEADVTRSGCLGYSQ